MSLPAAHRRIARRRGGTHAVVERIAGALETGAEREPRADAVIGLRERVAVARRQRRTRAAARRVLEPPRWQLRRGHLEQYLAADLLAGRTEQPHLHRRRPVADRYAHRAARRAVGESQQLAVLIDLALPPARHLSIDGHVGE